MMLHLCPYCGYRLNPKLTSPGFGSCGNCNRVFDDSSYHRVLSAAWVCRKWHIEDAATLQQKCILQPEEANFVEHYIHDLLLSHDEFLQVLKNIELMPNYV